MESTNPANEELPPQEDALEDENWIEPEFLNPDDVVEVVVDDDQDEPMDEPEEDEADDAGDADDANGVVVPDTSNVQIRSHTGPVYCVAGAVVQDSLLIVSGGGDDKAYLHRIQEIGADGSQEVQMSSTLLSHQHSDTVSSVAHNMGPGHTPAPHSLVAVGGYDGAIVVYDATTGSTVATLDGPTDVEWLSFHKSGTVLLAGSSSDGTVWMYHIVGTTQASCLQVFVGHAGNVSAGGFTPDGKWAVTTGADGAVRVWAPKTGVAKHTVTFVEHGDTDAAPGLTSLAFGTLDTATSQLVVVGAENGQAHVVHVGTGKVVQSLRHYEVPLTPLDHDTEDATMDLPMSVEAVAFCPHNPLWCATGGMDGVLKIWDLTNGQVRHVCQGGNESGGITQLAWHATLPVVWTATTAGSIRLWDARTGALLETHTTGSLSTINAMHVIVRTDARTLVLVASDDDVVRLFDINVPNLLNIEKRPHVSTKDRTISKRFW